MNILKADAYTESKDEITVVSQFPKDIEMAHNLKLQTQLPTDFYALNILDFKRR